MNVYAVVTYEDGLEGRKWWVATVDAANGGGATQARRLDKLVDAIAELVIVHNDLPDDTEVSVTLDFSGVPDLAALIGASQDADAEAAVAADRAREARRALAKATGHLTARDLAVALGVSVETAAKLRREAKVA